MSAQAAPLPVSPGPFPVEIPQSNLAESSGLWDRITTWASEHKGTVYAIAGVTLVVTAAGTMYYLSDSKQDGSAPSPPATKRKSKRDRKKAKERAEKEKGAVKEEAAAGMHPEDLSWTDPC